jgi:hypothetical protein
MSVMKPQGSGKTTTGASLSAQMLTIGGSVVYPGDADMEKPSPTKEKAGPRLLPKKGAIAPPSGRLVGPPPVVRTGTFARSDVSGTARSD